MSTRPEIGPLRDVRIHPTADIETGSQIGRGTAIWRFCHISRGATIGKNCVLGQNVEIGPNVTVGNGCKIQNNVSVYFGVTLEDNVFLGPSMVFTNVLTPRAHVERKSEFLETNVGEGATVGANAVIVCGNSIGAYSMIGAGSVVTKNIPDYALVLGNPGRQVGWVSNAGERLADDLVCPRTGERYELVNGQLRPLP